MAHQNWTTTPIPSPTDTRPNSPFSNLDRSLHYYLPLYLNFHHGWKYGSSFIHNTMETEAPPPQPTPITHKAVTSTFSMNTTKKLEMKEESINVLCRLWILKVAGYWINQLVSDISIMSLTCLPVVVSMLESRPLKSDNDDNLKQNSGAGAPLEGINTWLYIGYLHLAVSLSASSVFGIICQLWICKLDIEGQ